MLKQIKAIFCLFIYLPAIIGVGFSSHYCFGEHKETKAFSFSKQDCCCGEAEKEKNNCCGDEIEIVKLKDNQFSGTQPILPKASETILVYSFIFSPQLFRPIIVQYRDKVNHGALIVNNLSVKNCVFRI